MDEIRLSQSKDSALKISDESSDEMVNRDRKINEKRSARSIEAAFPSTKWVQANGDDRDDVFRAVSSGHHPSLYESFEDRKYDPVGNKKLSDFNFTGVSDPNPVLSTSHDDYRRDVYRAAGRSYNSMDTFSMGKGSLKGRHPSPYQPFEDSKFDTVGIKKTSKFRRASKTNPMSLSVGSSPQKIEPFAVSVKPKQKAKKKENIAQVVDRALLEKNLEKKIIKKLSTFYNRCNSIVLLVENGRESEEYVKQTCAIICEKMSMLLNLTFMPHKRELKFVGSYYYAYEVCYFDATVWKKDRKNAKSDMPETEYIIEFRRRSLTGHGAFEQLLRRAAGWLFEEKRAEKYGNGFKIYPYYEESCLDIGDGVDDEIFDSPSPSSVEETSESDSSCQIRLESDLICSWAKIIKERSTYSEDNIRILAICSKDRENTELMASEPKLHEALCYELDDGKNPSSCVNALTIVEAILRNYGVDGVAKSFIESKILLSVTKCLLQHSNWNLKQSKSAGSLRSVAIEKAAIRILKMLTEYQKLWFARQEVEEVLENLKKYQGDCTVGLDKGSLTDVTDVIEGLKKKIQKS